MKNSMWLGAGAWLVSALLLPGCGASDGGMTLSGAEDSANTDGSSEGTNTGNGSCVGVPACAFPRVLSAVDGKVYAGELVIYAEAGPMLMVEGFEVLDTAAGCEVAQFPRLYFSVPLSAAAIDESGRKRFHAQAGVTNVDADLTLTNELDLSGTITAHLATDSDGATVLAGTPDSVAVGTTVFTVQGKVSVSCSLNKSAVTIPLDEHWTLVEQLTCVQQPGFTPCNDIGNPTP